MNRRDYLKNLSLLLGGLTLSSRLSGNSFFSQTQDKNKTVLLCTGLQYQNIGDLGHVTGILNLLKIHLPEVQIILWPRIHVQEFYELIKKYWPDVKIITSRLLDEEGIDFRKSNKRPIKPDNDEIVKIIEQVDFAIGGHGLSGEMRWLAENYQFPYGIFGVTVNDSPTGWYKKLIDNASFFYTRETTSLENLNKANVKSKAMDFAPDATFGSIIEDDQKASAFMSKHGLKSKEFICVVPRLRIPPNYQTPPTLRHDPTPWTEERIREADEFNNKHKEKDHAKVRDAMITWVRRTGHSVVVCPEVIHQIKVLNELLIDPLPEDVKSKVIQKDHYWLNDEAATIYKNAVTVLSFECHSPILAYVKGTPAFYLRQPEDGGVKGQMYYDLGLTDWIFEIEQTTGEEITNRLMEVYNDYYKARIYLESAMDDTRKLLYKSMGEIRKIVLQ